MKRLISLSLALVLSLSLFAGCAKEEESKTMTLFTWEGMFPQEVLDGFTKETGIEINYVNFDFDETMLAKLEAAEGGEYDLIIADDYIIETAIAQGLVQKLDKSKISKIGNVNPFYQGQFFDPNNEYTVPYGAGVMALAYNPANVEKEITSYEDLWDASLSEKIGVVGNYRVVNGMALKTMGESYNTNDVAVIEEAGAKMLELAPNIRLIKDDNIQDDLISGEIDVAVMYTSQVTMAMLANPDLKVVFPEEGFGFGVMAQFIPSKAPNAENAHKFIDYILQPEISKQCYEWMGYYCTNAKADELIDDAYKSFLTLPEGIDASSAEMIENISAEADAAHTKVWTEFKAACGQ